MKEATKNGLRAGVVGGAALAASGSALAQAYDYTSLGAAVDWTSVGAVLGVVGVAIIGITVVMKGIKLVVRMVKGA